jgi:hypothetical protein
MAHRRSTEIHRDRMVMEYLTGNIANEYTACSARTQQYNDARGVMQGHSTSDG